MTDVERLAEEIRQLRAHLPAAALDQPPRGLAKWLDLRVNVGTLLALFVLVGGGYLAIRDQVQTAISSGVRNAGEIRRVESDSRERDKEIEARFRDAFQEHKDGYHSGRRGASVNGGGSSSALPDLALPMLSAHGGGR